MASLPDDLYSVLGVAPDATDDQIKKSYRKLARQLHPDLNPGDAAAEERFKQVSLAYEILSDAGRRKQYDRQVAGGGDPFAGFAMGGINDLFEAFFGGGGGGGGGGVRQQRRGGPSRGPDLETSVELTFHDAVFGATQEVVVRALVTCATCEGGGAKAGTQSITCPTCGGSGAIRRVRQSILGQMVTEAACSACAGSGEFLPDPCPDCRGDGRRAAERSYLVEVPAGVDDGATLRLGGRGAAGLRGGPAGDLYVHLRVARHAAFIRQGDALAAEFPVTVAQAVLGAELGFATLDGDVVVNLPAGTQHGKEIRFRNKGVPHLDGRGRGDLILHVKVIVPTDLSKEEDDLYRRLATERNEPVAPPQQGLVSRLKGAFR